jgi:hypothetical protein
MENMLVVPTRNMWFVPPRANQFCPVQNGQVPLVYHQALLDHQQLRSVRFAASNILLEAFTSGNLPCVLLVLLPFCKGNLKMADSASLAEGESKDMNKTNYNT